MDQMFSLPNHGIENGNKVKSVFSFPCALNFSHILIMAILFETKFHTRLQLVLTCMLFSFLLSGRCYSFNDWDILDFGLNLSGVVHDSTIDPIVFWTSITYPLTGFTRIIDSINNCIP